MEIPHIIKIYFRFFDAEVSHKMDRQTDRVTSSQHTANGALMKIKIMTGVALLVWGCQTERSLKVSDTPTIELPTPWNYQSQRERESAAEEKDRLSATLLHELGLTLEYRPQPIFEFMLEMTALGDSLCPEMVQQSDETQEVMIIEDDCETEAGLLSKGSLNYERTMDSEGEYSLEEVSVYGEDFRVIHPDGRSLYLSGYRDSRRESSDEELVTETSFGGLIRVNTGGPVLDPWVANEVRGELYLSLYYESSRAPRYA